MFPFHRLLLPVVLCLGLTACSTRQPLADEIPRLPVAQPRVLDSLYVQEYVAEIQSVRNVEIRARTKGFLATVHVDEGQRVSQGQLLFTFDTRALRDQLLQAQAQLKSAEAQLKAERVEELNVRRLVERNIVARTELEKELAEQEAARARIEEAQANLSTARLALSLAEVRAPFAGIINRLPRKGGSLVEEGELLTTLSDNSNVFAYFHVSEREYLEFKQSGQLKDAQVQLELVNGQLYPHGGQITAVEGEIDPTTGNLAFRARFPNPDNLLKHGLTGKVRIPRPLTNALVVEQRSTYEVQDQLYVYVLDSANRVQLRSIRPAQRLQHIYVVAEGLAPSDRIVVEGVQRLKPGVQIEPLQAQPRVATNDR